MPNISAEHLTRTVVDVFAAAGCSGAEAARIAHYLVAANLTGHDSHGVARIARYVPLLRDGVIVADQKVDLLVDTPAIAVVDGKYGFGQTVAPPAVAIGVEKCKATGLSAVALRNAGHVGRLSDWAEIAARAGFVSIHFCNAAGSVLVAPFGSAERRFSTAPYCVGVPLAGREPLLLDFATSIVAEGKVFVASQGGRPIPHDALIGPDGAPSDDARLLYGDYASTGKRDLSAGKGAIRAFGDHKGSGLALMCELLGGALSGTGATRADRGRLDRDASVSEHGDRDAELRNRFGGRRGHAGYLLQGLDREGRLRAVRPRPRRPIAGRGLRPLVGTRARLVREHRALQGGGGGAPAQRRRDHDRRSPRHSHHRRARRDPFP